MSATETVVARDSRSGRDRGRLARWSLPRCDRRAIASYLGKSNRFDRAIAEFSQAYADHNQAEYEVLIEAQRSGDLEVESGL